MIALYIIAGIVLLLALLLSGNIRIEIKYDGEPHISVGYFFIKLNDLFIKVPDIEKKDKPVKKSKKESPAKAKAEDMSKLDTIQDLLNSAKEPLKKLLERAYITDVSINIIAGADDAAQAAIKYGKTCWVVYSALSVLKNYLNIKIKDINLGCDFFSDETVYDISLKIKIRAGTFLLLFAAFYIHLVRRTYASRAPRQTTRAKVQ